MTESKPSNGDSVTHNSFEKILNFRDVGEVVNSLSGSDLLKDGLLFRSARPDDASSSDRRRLVEEYGISTVIDLRSKYDLLILYQTLRICVLSHTIRSEHINQAKKKNMAVSSSAAVPQSQPAVAELLKIPNIRYEEINLNGGGFERALLWQLSWSSLGKLASFMTFGYRTEAIGIIGREVMQVRGLTGLGIDTLDHSGKELRQAFEVLAKPSNFPILVHCTQGKDRTGLIILLTLLLLGIPPKAISEDYLKSEPELLPEKEERMREIRAVGLTEEFAGCPPDFVQTLTQHIDTKYGGIKDYLLHIGVGEDLQEEIRGILLRREL